MSASRVKDNNLSMVLAKALRSISFFALSVSNTTLIKAHAVTVQGNNKTCPVYVHWVVLSWTISLRIGNSSINLKITFIFL